MNDRYRRKKEPIDDFYTLKQNEISKIIHQIEDTNVHKRINWKLVLIPLTVLILSLLFIPQLLIQKTPNSPAPNFTFTKVNATEYVLKTEQYQFTIKSYALMENTDIIQYNEDFSYYKDLSQYTDYSQLIGNEIKLNITPFNIYDRYFLEVNLNGKISYYEIKNSSGGFDDVNITRLQFTEFEKQMKEILDLIKEYPPIPGDKINTFYDYNPQIDNLENEPIYDMYRYYVTHYYEEVSTERRNGLIFNYFIYIEKKNDQYIIINDHAISTSIFGDYKLEGHYYNPLIDGFKFIYNFNYTEDGLGNGYNMDPEAPFMCRMYTSHIFDSDNKKYNNKVLVYLLMDTKPLKAEGKTIGKIELIYKDSNEKVEITNLISYNDYLFSIPIIVHPSLNFQKTYNFMLYIYDQDGNKISSIELNRVFASNED